MIKKVVKAIILISVSFVLVMSMPAVYAAAAAEEEEEEEEEGKASLGSWAENKASEEAEDEEAAGETEDSTLLGAASDGEETELTLYGIPVLAITLSGTTLDTINSGSKTIKYEGNAVSVTDASDSSYNLNATDVEIKGHGNSTWLTDKKPYQIKFKKKNVTAGTSGRQEIYPSGKCL